VRFTTPGTGVAAHIETRGSEIVISVQDQGPGVPAAELERIFEPFYRVAASRDRSSGGTGLGLAIAARVVALHAGRITARNAAEGGLTIEISLPRQPSEPGQSRTGRTAQEAARPALGGRITPA